MQEGGGEDHGPRPDAGMKILDSIFTHKVGTWLVGIIDVYLISYGFRCIMW